MALAFLWGEPAHIPDHKVLRLQSQLATDVLPFTLQRLRQRGLHAVVDAAHARGMPVETVTAAVVDAITAKSPRPNAILGASAKAGNVLAMLPIRLRDRAIRASVGLR